MPLLSLLKAIFEEISFFLVRYQEELMPIFWIHGHSLDKLLSILLLLSTACGQSLAMLCSRFDNENQWGVSQNGDVLLGGLFNLFYIPSYPETLNFTTQPNYGSCKGLEHGTLKSVYAMAFAVEEINRNSSLLQGVKLGYRILDSCGRHPWDLAAALSLISGSTPKCQTESPESSENEEVQVTPVIIDASSSTTARILSNVLAPLSTPIISGLASCPCLSERAKYPNFFRTIPSDVFQSRAMAQLAIRFKWSWVGAVIANNDYGQLALQVFQKEIEGNGICVDFISPVNRETIKSDAKAAALTIQASTARVILIFCWYTDVREVFTHLAKRNITGRQFLASEAWSTSEDIIGNLDLLKVTSGVLGVAIRSAEIPGFENYVRSLHPSQRPHDRFLREYWEGEFGCTPLPSSSSALPPCNGTESLYEVHSHFTDMSQLRVTYNVYLAVYAAAHAIHSLLSCPNTEATATTSNCSSPKNITPAQLLQHLNKVNISTPHGEWFGFQGADIQPKFDLVNWQKAPEGSLRLVLIGRVDGFDIELNETAIQWSTGSSQVPVSVCTKSCEPGTRKAIRKGEPVCCFDCIPCGDGEVSNKTDSLQCKRCPLEFWSNSARTSCIPRQLDFLSFNDTLGITLTTVAVSGAVVTTAVFVVFLYSQQTPVVRANNKELSFLLLVSLKLCFLCSLVFIGRPSVWSCRFQQAAFGISFVLCVSCLLVKTMVVLAAFRSARPGSETLMKWFGPHQQRGSVGLFTTIQIIICLVWLCISPPEPYVDMDVQGSKVTLECAMASVLGFSLVLGYIGLLACSCLLLAFLARKLPDNFNEAKLITFSMLIFCAVWVAFVPAYVSSPGKYVVAVEIFAILASTYALLICIFAPKCYIILLKPEKNTKKHIIGR